MLHGARIACVGPATAEAAAEAGLHIDVVPDEHVGAAVAAAMHARTELSGARVLWPRGAAAEDTVAADLRAAGAHVTAPVAYRSRSDEEGARGLARAILQGAIDVVTFTSPSGVRSLTEVLPGPMGVRTVVIGPVTAQAAHAAGYGVDAVAVEHTAAGMIEALRTLYG